MKVFISYHRGDTKQKNKLESILEKHKIAFYSVPEGSDFSGQSHEGIKTLIIGYLRECDVIICLVGKETYTRPHVDHELHEAFKGVPGTRKGIVALLIENRGDSKNNIDLKTFPKRLADNLKDYVVLDQFSTCHEKIVGDIEQAFANARNPGIIVVNNFKTMQLRHSRYYDN